MITYIFERELFIMHEWHILCTDSGSWYSSRYSIKCVMAANFWASTHYRNWLRNADNVMADMQKSIKRYVSQLNRRFKHFAEARSNC